MKSFIPLMPLILGLSITAVITYFSQKAIEKNNKIEDGVSFRWWTVWALLNLTIGNILTLGQGVGNDLLGFAFFMAVIFSVLSIMILKFNKYAFLIATILSLNPLLWIINGVYLKKRWYHPRVNKEKNKVVSITPIDAIYRLNKLALSDEEFRQVHHGIGSKGENETVKSHIDYLTSIKKYQNKESNNYIVGLRLAYLENLENQGSDRQTSIDKCKEKYPVNEVL